MRSEAIIIEQLFTKPIETVWKAITVKEEMVKWYFENIPDFKAEVGFKTRFNVKAPSRDYMHIWKVTLVKAPNKITYEWTYDDLQGKGEVTFELLEQGSVTILKLTNTGLDSFPNDLPEFTKESCIAGWTYFIQERLLNYLG